MCRNITQEQSDSLNDAKDVDNLLRELRRYYDDVKLHRKLSLPVPAGFRQNNNLQQLYQSFTPPRKARASADLPSSDILSTKQIEPSALLDTHSDLFHRLSDDSLPNKSVQLNVPVL